MIPCPRSGAGDCRGGGLQVARNKTLGDIENVLYIEYSSARENNICTKE